MLQRVVIFLAVLSLALYAFAQFVRRTGMFFPSPAPPGGYDVTRYSIRPIDEWLTTPDGVRLHAWLFRAADPGAPLLIWFHGNGGNLENRGEIAHELAQRGISTFVFDWRGYGRSSGSPSEEKLYIDALAAYDFASRGIDPKRIALYGESLGGPYAAYTASHRRARCVIIENSLPSMRALGNALYHPLPLGWFAPLAMRTTTWLNDANVPVLVMHGKRDRVIPFALGRELYDGLTVPKRFFVSETAGHSEIPSIEGARYYEAVHEFLTNEINR